MPRLRARAGVALLVSLLGACSGSPRPRTAEDGVLSILQAVEWGMSRQAVQARFPGKAFVPAVSYQGQDGVAFVTGYRDDITGQHVFIGFHFAADDRLVRVAWSFDVADQDQVERSYAKYADRFRRQFGVPLVEAEGGITTSRWKTPRGILIIGTTDKPGFAIQGWDERHFLAAAKTAR